MRYRSVIILTVLLVLGSFYGSCVAAETKVIAASNSSAEWKAKADFQCDGKDDQAEIVEAVKSMSSGGTIILAPGNFDLNDNIKIQTAGIIIQGQGEDATVLNCKSGSRIQLTGENTAIKNLKITGGGRVHVSSSNIIIENITAYDLDNSSSAAFLIYPYDRIIEGIQIINCKAIDCDRPAFAVFAEGYTADKPFGLKNVLFKNCQAINSGRYGQKSGAVNAGYSITANKDGGTFENVTYDSCVADGSWESGFYIPSTYKVVNFKYINCISRNNGQKGAGQGFEVVPGVIMENCTSEGNASNK